MSLKIAVSKKKNYTYVIKLIGSLDTGSADQLEGELAEIINGQTKAVVFDMGGVEYICSLGIGLVIKTKKSLESKGATFAMIDLQPQIKKVFDMMKILPIFDIFDDMPEADKYIDEVIKEELEKNKI